MTPELLTNVLIPLGSAAIGGILGGYFGYRGALRVQNREDANRCRAAGRALLIEVSRNYQALEDVQNYEVPGYSDAVWYTQLPLVAQLLTWDDLQTLAEPYIKACGPLSALGQAAELKSKGQETPAGKLSQNSRQQLWEVRKMLGTASEMLRHKVLTDQEYRDFSTSHGKGPIGGKPDGNSTPSV
ncbi:MAG TPA: hypothetical protein VMV27_09575 [Candidatus Binataceae bacterium]|nr:hypothetical protein [Candidatus Binataceae bacterium]